MKKQRKYRYSRDEAPPEEVSRFPFPWQFVQRNYSDLYLMSCVPESQVQKDVVQLLKTYRVDVAPIDAGGRRARGVLMGVAKNAGINIGRLAGVKTGNAIPKGFADLEATLAPSGRSLYIEIKAPAWCDQGRRFLRSAGEASEEQLSFLHEKFKRGAIVLVAWSAGDVEDYLGGMLRENRKACAC